MKEALLYKKLPNNQIQCNACHHHCIIKDGQRGICGVRKNENGKLVSLVYGKAAAAYIDPIEKKPFFHFLPGSLAFSIGTFGCNFSCTFCQNWEISQAPKEEFFWHETRLGKDWLPSKIVSEALKQDCRSIAYTYNEPTVFLEYALETMKIAKEANLKNIWISNGYMSKEVRQLILPYLDAINIDFKSSQYSFYSRLCGASLKPVLENMIALKEAGVWLEITTLIIPQENDKLKDIKAIISFIRDNLGRDIPWHVSRFFPAYQMRDREPTDEKIIDQAIKTARQMGLKYVYGGNLPHKPILSNTYCPYCNTLIVERNRNIVRRFDKNGSCPQCHRKINMILE
jgi:pyruvate formate lyase activating enzyme